MSQPPSHACRHSLEHVLFNVIALRMHVNKPAFAQIVAEAGAGAGCLDPATFRAADYVSACAKLRAGGDVTGSGFKGSVRTLLYKWSNGGGFSAGAANYLAQLAPRVATMASEIAAHGDYRATLRVLRAAGLAPFCSYQVAIDLQVIVGPWFGGDVCRFCPEVGAGAAPMCS